jgi:hypothetical protein
MTESKVTDAARNAARDAIWAVLCPSVRSTPEDAKIYGHAAEMALEAALPLLSQPVSGERVRELIWGRGEYPREDMEFADSVFGAYAVWDINGGIWRRPEDNAGRIVNGTLDDAKAAAQADFEARILSALSQSPPSGERGDKL